MSESFAKDPSHRLLPAPLVTLIGIDACFVETEQYRAFVLYFGLQRGVGADQWRVGAQRHELWQSVGKFSWHYPIAVFDSGTIIRYGERSGGVALQGREIGHPMISPVSLPGLTGSAVSLSAAGKAAPSSIAGARTMQAAWTVKRAAMAIGS